MIVKINPADVVSIPTDYNGAKGRCCRYQVVAEVKTSPLEAFSSIVNGEFDPVDETDSSTEGNTDNSENHLPPEKSWPFPTTSKNLPTLSSAQTPNHYEVRRIHGGAVEETGLTLTEAQDRVKKNIRQKKASLAVYDSNTGTRV